MRSLEIRRMQEEDLREVVRIEAENFSLPWSEKSFRESLALPHVIFLTALVDGQAAGYCGCYQSLEEAEITNVCVDKRFRGQGVAETMLRELMRIGKEQGAFAFTLEVRISNEAAIHLYEKLGFESVGIRKRFYEKPVEDAMIMWRRWEA